MTDRLTRVRMSDAVLPSRERASFRLTHLFYSTAVLAAAISLWGPWGMLVGAIVCAFWAYVLWGDAGDPRRRMWQAEIAVLTLMFLSCCVLGFPLIEHPRAGTRRMMCQGRLKQLSLALFNYESDYGTFPPAITYDQQGTPMHSWRVLILPYIEEDRLYQQYRFDEPWDGPNNAKLLPKMPELFRCPESPSAVASGYCTSYCLVLDEQAMFASGVARKLSDVPDGLSNTVAIVESAGFAHVPWMAPQELSPQGYIESVRTWGYGNPPKHAYSTRFTHYFIGENVALADGTVVMLKPGASPDELWKLVRIDDGPAGETAFGNGEKLQRARVDGYISLVAFLGLAVLPIGTWCSPLSHSSKADGAYAGQLAK